MINKIFATSCLAGMVIVGATGLASAAPNPSDSGPSNSPTTPTTTTTSMTNAPYPGHMGY